jgi:hypothetical protein
MTATDENPEVAKAPIPALHSEHQDRTDAKPKTIAESIADRLDNTKTH